MAQVSAAHIAPAGGGFEPQRSFNWSLILPGLGNGAELIRLSVESMRGFNVSNAVIDMRFQNESRKAAGGFIMGGSAISVRDWVDQRVLAALQSWRSLVHDPITGEIGYASAYKKNCSLQLLDSKGEPKREIVLLGVWPSSMSTTDFSYNATTGQVKVSLDLVIDMYKLIV